MKRSKDLSIRKKLFFGMLIFSVLLVVMVTNVAMIVSYRTMREQLIYNRRVSIRWLQDRLNTEVERYSDQFYEFEVNKSIKDGITSWCSKKNEINYTVKLRLISALNETISMDKNINSMEIYNLIKEEAIIAKRSGADLERTENKLEKWKERDSSLQTNIVFQRTEKEIIVYHEIYSFLNKEPLVLMTMHLRPYDLEEILEDIQTTTDESILIFNDERELIEAQYGAGSSFQEKELIQIMDRLESSDQQEIYLDGKFWFFRDVKGGKLKILMAVPNSSIVAALSNTLIAGLGIGLVAVIISTAGAILFSRAFSKPIIRLSATMRTTTIEDFSGINLQERKDEIGILHDSFAIMLARNKELIAQEYQSKLEKREAQIRALQAQINPHFMYNTLQVIGGMSLKRNAPEIYNITTALSDIMRYSLNFSDEMVCLKEEIHYFQSYLTIQDERFGNRLSLEIKIPEEFLEYLIPKLILQPLLENSMEHGLSGKSGVWRILLESTLTSEGDLLLMMEDNGVGITPERLEEIRQSLKKDTEKSLKSSAHIGLCNVNSRIKLGYSEAKYGITIESVYGEGTRVKVLIKALKGEKGNDKI